MRSFRQEICSWCQGNLAICKSPLWRRAVVEKFDDLEDENFDCPYPDPVAIDNATFEKLLAPPRPATPDVHTEEKRKLVGETLGKCSYAEKVNRGSCCPSFKCHHPETEGYVYPGQYCSALCPNFTKSEEVEEDG